MSTSAHSQKLRVAIIGAGGISGAHARGILHYSDKIECVALCDISDENLQKRSQQLGGGQKLFQDWKKMLAEYGSEFEAAIICLPHHLHTQAILDCAAAGKHILCEKPLCIDLEEADVIVEAVKKAGIVFMPGHNALFNPFVVEVKRFLEAGLIGKVLHLRSQECFVNTADFSQAWRGRSDLQGGGELIDTGYHGTYSLLYFADSPVAEIKCTMARFRHRIDGEDTASVQILFENGSIGEIFTSWALPLPYGTHSLHILGEKGQIFGSGNVLYYLPEGFSEPAKIQLKKTETHTEQIGYFVECVRSGALPLHSVEDSRDVLRVILKASENANGWQQHATLKLS